MEGLPIEILEIIFCPLSARKDIEKCINTCTKWRKIIQNIYPNFDKTKVLVVTGNASKTLEHLEIIDLIDSTLENDVFVDKMTEWHGCHGCILQNQLLICGGFDRNNSYSKDCSIALPKYKKSFEMLKPRIYASSVEINQNSLWITGGIAPWISSNHPLNVEKSTEIISLNSPPIEGKPLPFTIYYHSMVAVDQNTIYLIGGNLDGHDPTKDLPTKKTWIIDPTNNFDLKPGPSLQIGRSQHSSSKIKINRKIYLVVAGGQNYGTSREDVNYGRLESVELLDTTSPDQGWIIGKT